jgi:hypothetical protein
MLSDYGPLAPLLRNTIDTAIISEQWDQLVDRGGKMTP